MPRVRLSERLASLVAEEGFQKLDRRGRGEDRAGELMCVLALRIGERLRVANEFAPRAPVLPFRAGAEQELVEDAVNRIS